MYFEAKKLYCGKAKMPEKIEDFRKVWISKWGWLLDTQEGGLDAFVLHWYVCVCVCVCVYGRGEGGISSLPELHFLSAKKLFYTLAIFTLWTSGGYYISHSIQMKYISFIL